MDKSWKVFLAFAGVFIAGAICGCLVGVRVMRHLAPPPRAVLGLNFGPQMLKRLGDQLDLTPAQVTQIQPIVERAQIDVQKLRWEHVHEMTQVMDRLHSDISAILNPDQRTKLNELRKKVLERAERIHREMHPEETPSPARP
jgi:Spy/CpxP family protein refolding chaperone